MKEITGGEVTQFKGKNTKAAIFDRFTQN